MHPRFPRSEWKDTEKKGNWERGWVRDDTAGCASWDKRWGGLIRAKSDLSVAQETQVAT